MQVSCSMTPYKSDLRWIVWSSLLSIDAILLPGLLPIKMGVARFELQLPSSRKDHMPYQPNTVGSNGTISATSGVSNGGLAQTVPKRWLRCLGRYDAPRRDIPSTASAERASETGIRLQCSSTWDSRTSPVLPKVGSCRLLSSIRPVGWSPVLL